MMSASQQLRLASSQMRKVSNPASLLDEHMLRALNMIKRPSTAEEIAELLNRDLGTGDRPFETREVNAWLRKAGDTVLNLYWLENRPRR